MKKHNKNAIANKQNVIALAVVVVAVGLICYFAYQKINTYNYAADQASLVSVRELILSSTENLKKDAPVEPRTGDVYFPESNLYLPRPESSQKITYSYYESTEDGYPSVLRISTSPVFGQERLFSVKNTDELFEQIPKLQACSRGAAVTKEKLSQLEPGTDLKHTVQLTGGNKLYLYQESDCPELNNLVGELKNLQAY